MKRLTSSQKTLLDMLANTLFGANRPISIDEPENLWREAVYQAVFLLALRDAGADAFPGALLTQIRESIRFSLGKNIRVARGHSEISRLLEEAGIGHVLIKGHASALWYPEPELRQLGDVDFYVDRRDVRRTEALLKREGYTAEKTSHGFHHVFAKDGCRYELHFGIPGVPAGKDGAACRACFDSMIARSAVRHTPFGDMRLPSAFHHGLILLLHTAHHLTYSGVGLRHLCDWAVFADTLPEEDFLREFKEPLTELGLWNFACCLTDICVRYLGVRQKSWLTGSDEALGDALLEDLIAGGNFGQKNIVRSRQAYLITSGKRSDSRVGRLFSVMLDMIYQKWPVSKKIKILVPFGWAFYTLRYFWRVIRGKRPKLYVRSAVRGAKERTELYDRLRLFDSTKEEL